MKDSELRAQPRFEDAPLSRAEYIAALVHF